MTLTTLIAELEEALKAATPGPWEVPPDDYYNRPGPIVLHYTDVDADEDGIPHDYGQDICEMADTDNDEANARLIALMRTHLPALIEENERLREALIADESLIEHAQAVLTEYLMPDGLSGADAISMLLELFDGTYQRATASLARTALKGVKP